MPQKRWYSPRSLRQLFLPLIGAIKSIPPPRSINNKKFGDKTYIKWNFTKFLVDREGKVIARFEPTVDMKEVRDAVAAAL